jgi:hypothetical protein
VVRGLIGSPGSYAKEAVDAHNGVVGSVLTTVQNAGTLKLASNTPVGAWVSLELPTSIKLQRIEMRPRLQHLSETDLNEVALQAFPREFGIWGYDGSSWVLLKSVTGHSAGSAFGYTPTHVNATTAYNKYAIVVTRTNAVGGSNSDDRNFTAIGQLYFYGYEEGSGSLDTTLKSVYNVPVTTGTQLDVYYDAKDLTTMPSTVTDLSPNTNNGTVSGDPQISNGAFVFDGSGDAIVSSGTSTSLDGNATFSISLWSKTNTVSSGSNALFMLGYSSANKSTGLRIDASTGKYRFFTTGGLSSKTSPTTALLNEWTHISLIHEGTSGYKFYVNGVFIDEITVDNDLSLDSNPRVALGNYIDAAGVVTGTASYDGSIANFRLYSKALNADQVKELYDYQKDYFLGSKSQVTLYKGHLGVGVTEPSGQLELAGDERIQEYPPRGMTDFDTYIEGHGVFKASASSQYSDAFEPWGAFSDTSDYDLDIWVSGNDEWYTSNGYPSVLHYLSDNTPGGAWIKIEMPYKIKLNSFSFVTGTRNYSTETFPENFQIWASNNGTEWNHIYSVSGFGNPPNETGGTGWGHTNVNSQTYYSMYAMVITKVYMVGNFTRFFVSIPRWKLFGTPGPTTLDKGSLSLTRSLDVPRVSRYDVDTETPRPEKLVVDFDTTVNSSPTDISGRGNHGTLVGATYSAADKAFNFDGTDDLIRATVQVTPDFAHSVSVWIKVDTVGENTFFSLGNETTVGTDLTLKSSTVYTTGSGFTFTFYGGDMTIPFSYSTDRWYHIVATRDTGGTFPNTQKFYIDGVDYSASASWNNSTSTTLALPTTATLLIGKILWATSARFDGQISNFKIYSVALEPSEVKKLYNLGRTGRSMVISDTAVGIGKVPEAQLDVRGDLRVGGRLLASVPYYAARQRNTNSYVFDESIVYDQYVYTNYPGSFVANSATDGYYQPPMNGMYQVHMECIANGSGNILIQRRTGTTVDISHDERHFNYTQSGWMSTSADALIPITNCVTQNIRIYIDGTGGDGAWQYNTYHGSAFFLWVSDIPERRQHHVA